MKHLTWPVAVTRAGMVAEQVMRAFWPAWSIIFVMLAPLMFGVQDMVPRAWVWGFGAVGGVALLVAVIWGARRFRMPQRAAAVARVDAALPGRPIAAIADTQAIGTGDVASEAVWQAHVARMMERTKEARPVEPDLRVADRDPYGLRFVALLVFVVALLFGSLWRVASVVEPGGTQTLATGPVWEGWVEPPAYTGKPSIYLNDVPAGALTVPAGSQITLRIYGEVGALTVTETVSGTEVAEGDAQGDITASVAFMVAQDGRVAIEGETGIAWDVTMTADLPPVVEFNGPITADAMGEMTQPFLALDDYGVVSGTATIALDLDAVDRRYGLAVDPDDFEPVVIDLPVPFSGDRSDFEDVIVDDFSKHPFSNLPVTMTLSVVDAAGQVATSPAEPMVLPGRRFFQPFARAIIEQRRDLMWSTDNLRRISQVMKAIAYRPEGLFSNEITYLRMRAIMRRIDAFVDEDMPYEVREEIVEALWELAIQLEDGTLADARERLRRAQERLSEAIRNGASDAEIAELMQELQEATDQYMQMLADQMDPNDDGTDQADNGQGGQDLSMDELQAMRDRIQELMEEGRMAEAQALLEEYNRILENLQITQGEGGNGGPRTPGQQAMEDLEDTLREQEQLSDDAFRELQEQTNPNRQQQGQQGQQGEQGQQQGQQGQQGQQPGQQQGQNGQQGGDQPQPGQNGQQGDQNQNGQGQGAPDAGTLAERQQALRDGLGRLRGALPSLDGEAGENARDSLRRAERAMEGAEGALESGDLPGAIDQQAEALDALRDGMRNLDQALAENQSDQPGQADQNSDTAGEVAPSEQDPLGRQIGQNGGQFGTEDSLLPGEDVYRRAEELLDELRRRSADQARPEVEKDYLKRLLDRF